MSVCAIAIVAEKSAVTAPIHAITALAIGAAAYRNESRHTMYTPAVTIVAAWISAETGCRTGHRVGQPHVERDLRRLARRADEQAQPDHVDEPPLAAPRRRDRALGDRAKCCWISAKPTPAGTPA
jgi:hypothetical protein